MTYAIIKVGGKQYRVREGERLLVDRLETDVGSTFSPIVLLIGGDGEPTLAPRQGAVTAKVIAAAQGPKVRIGKYRKRTGYRRHTGFRASLTQIEIESIGGKRARPVAQQKARRETVGLPAGYEGLTVVEIKKAVVGWTAEEVSAALAHEREHGKRKGALAALEAAEATMEGGS